MSNVLKFLLLAFGCIIVIGLITLSGRISKKGEGDSEQNLGQYNNVASAAEDADLKLYDNVDVKGSEIVDLIKKYNNHEYLSIVVDTKRGVSTAYVNACAETVDALPTTNSGIDFSALSDSKSNANYINEADTFHSTVYYDENDVVACIWFVQE
ncbi:MAG TPA: hypothetical protein VJ888_04995 [Mobilitalea sp.]|nr:hypothetical protein [Mobilitalea sp.]